LADIAKPSLIYAKIISHATITFFNILKMLRYIKW